MPSRNHASSTVRPNRRQRRAAARQKERNTSGAASQFDRAIEAHQQGDLATASAIYQAILEREPDHAHVLQLLGVVAMQSGRLADAQLLIARALTIEPTHVEAQFNLGVLRKAQGRIADAEALYRGVLARQPDHLGALTNLGNMLVARGETGQARPLLEQAARLAANDPAAHFNLALALRELAEYERALAHLTRAVQLDPAHIAAHRQLVDLYCLGDRFDLALRHARVTAEAQPDDPDARVKLATILAELRQFDEAGDILEQIARVKPDATEPRRLLARVRDHQGRLTEAATVLNELIRIEPAVEHYIHLGGVYDRLRQTGDAVACLEDAVSQFPRDSTLRINLAQALQKQNRIADADQHFRHALSLDPAVHTRFQHALLMPVLPDSVEEIDMHRGRMLQQLRSLSERGDRVDDPRAVYPRFRFYLAYHGRNDREIVTTISHFARGVCPDLTFTADHCVSVRQPCDGRLHIGFVSRHHRTHHTIAKLNRRFIEKFNRERFRVTLVDFEGAGAASPEMIAFADGHVRLPRNLARAQSIAAARRFDILFYTDIGMDADSYNLAHARLAPLQVATWGHPTTTGIDTIDLYLSSSLIEPEDAGDHYSETLHPMTHLPTCYPRLRPEALPPADRTGLRLPEDKTLYLCPQTLFKLHPEADLLFREIILGDPNGLLVLIDGLLREPLEARWRRHAPELLDRSVFVPYLPRERFLALIQSCDVMLDPPHFGGGNTTFEAMSTGTPIVTWPGPFMRARVTLGCYKTIGVADCIAPSRDAYARLAVDIGRNRDKRADIRDRILEHHASLYENTSAIRELEDVLAHAYQDRISR